MCIIAISDIDAPVNPWVSVWFQPQKTALWVKSTQPFYGVIVVLCLYALISFISARVGAGLEVEASQSTEALSGKHRLGKLIDTWLMPVMFSGVLYLVGRYLKGQATFKNIAWVLVWSQLPVILMLTIALVLQMAGFEIYEPVFNNKISSANGQVLIEPPQLQVNAHGLWYFMLSTLFLLWSFQILLSGTAAIQGITVKQALWWLTLAMIILMVVRLPVTLALGDRDILDVFGLKGIVELG